MTASDLTRDRVLAALGTRRYGRSLEVKDETGSTNDDARAALETGAPDGHVIVADQQTRGRGARGREWSSPAGTDLYFSIVARVAVPLPALPPLTLAVGLGVSRAVEALVPGAPIPARRIEVKWPNDVWVAGLKCAGVLVEASTRGPVLDGAVIGIGLDVNRDALGPLEGIATSLLLVSGSRLDRAAVLASVLGHVEEEVDRFVAHGPGPIAARIAERLALRGERVTCDEHEGTLIGVAPSGALRLRTDDGVVRELVAGTLRRADGDQSARRRIRA